MAERAGINLGPETVLPKSPIDRDRSFTILSVPMCSGSRAYTTAMAFIEPTITAVYFKHWALSVTMTQSVLISLISIVTPSLREGTNKNKQFIAPKMAVIRGKTWESIFQRTQLSPVIHW